jgi:PIN domain nuclease of toxin-antitoxin system
VRLLLDSHAFLWWLTDDSRLKDLARSEISNPQSLVHVSAATIWELTIKAVLGRLDSGDTNLVEEITGNGFVELAITALHAEYAGRLPRHHDDPFDRMLVAQALVEGLTCVTRNPEFSKYSVPTLW